MECRKYYAQRLGIRRGQLVAPPVFCVRPKADLKIPLGVELDKKLAMTYAMLENGAIL